MIPQSFIFLDRVSQRSERNIWNYASDWESFRSASKIPGFSPTRKAFTDRRLAEAQDAFERKDAAYFATRFPDREAYRLYPHYKDRVVFLDIETTYHYGDVTVIGLSDGESFKPLVRGFNLDKDILMDALKDARLIITFNGSSFDLPVIERYFHASLPQIPHIDLRHVCSRIGLSGGLKAIERQLGITRPELAEGVTGADAVYLWQEFQLTKDPAVLDTLIAYNRADVENMRALAEFAIPRLWNQIRSTNQRIQTRAGNAL